MTPVLRRRASWFLVRLQGDVVRQSDRTAFHKWLAQDPAHGEAFAEVASAVGEFSNLAPEVKRALKERLASVPSPARFDRRPFLVGATALAASVLVAGAWMFEAAPRTYESALGEHRAFVLRDGSHVELNTDTEIEVRMGLDGRRIRLLRGEALFEVAHDASRPFAVRADGREVRALGTAFVVRMDRDAFEVLVTEGVVSVSDADGLLGGYSELRVLAGQHLRATPADVAITSISLRETERRLAWRDGMARFAGEPLSDVVNEVARYTGASFVIVEPELGDLSVVAHLRASNLDGFVQSLESNFPELDVSREGTVVTIARARERSP